VTADVRVLRPRGDAGQSVTVVRHPTQPRTGGALALARRDDILRAVTAYMRGDQKARTDCAAAMLGWRPDLTYAGCLDRVDAVIDGVRALDQDLDRCLAEGGAT
jgi:hypothetical protein